MENPLLRIGVQPYIYTKPLYWNLTDLEPALELVEGTPRKLAAMIVAGDLDVAQVPFLTVLRNPTLSVIPEISISHKGKSRCAMLYSKVAPSDIKTVLVDRSSINSIALLRALFRIRWSMQPVEVLSSKPMSSEYPFHETDYDAFLLIGDEPLKIKADFHTKLDLSEQWKQWTDLSLVNVIWAVRKELEGPALDELFLHSKKAGLGNLAEIAREESSRLGIPEESCLRLFKDCGFDFGEEQEKGLERFHYYMSELKICEEQIELRFYHDDHISTRCFGKESLK